MLQLAAGEAPARDVPVARVRRRRCSAALARQPERGAGLERADRAAAVDPVDGADRVRLPRDLVPALLDAEPDPAGRRRARSSRTSTSATSVAGTSPRCRRWSPDEVGRPAAPMAYSNGWGSTLGLLTPFFVLDFFILGSPRAQAVRNPRRHHRAGPDRHVPEPGPVAERGCCVRVRRHAGARLQGNIKLVITIGIAALFIFGALAVTDAWATRCSSVSRSPARATRRAASSTRSRSTR